MVYTPCRLDLSVSWSSWEDFLNSGGKTYLKEPRSFSNSPTLLFCLCIWSSLIFKCFFSIQSLKSFLLHCVALWILYVHSWNICESPGWMIIIFRSFAGVGAALFDAWSPVWALRRPRSAAPPPVLWRREPVRPPGRRGVCQGRHDEVERTRCQARFAVFARRAAGGLVENQDWWVAMLQLHFLSELVSEVSKNSQHLASMGIPWVKGLQGKSVHWSLDNCRIFFSSYFVSSLDPHFPSQVYRSLPQPNSA